VLGGNTKYSAVNTSLYDTTHTRLLSSVEFRSLAHVVFLRMISSLLSY